MNGFGGFLYFIMFWATVGLFCSFAGGAWLLYYLLMHVRIVVA